MLSNYLLAPIPLWVLFAIVMVTLLLAMEAGYRINQGIRRRSPDKADVGLGTMVSASLSLLAFLLACTVGLAVNINSQRRRLVVAEANAISTLFKPRGLCR